jgi:Ca2+/H+ antiporter, TMEM165/GDT1 family
VEALLVAFAVVFVAELGDKSQLVALSMAARHSMRFVFLGLVLAYAAAQTLSVAVGAFLGAALPEAPLGLAGGVLFLAFALWTWRGGVEDLGEGDAPTSVSGRSVVASVAALTFVAELGDKTMLATGALATQGDPVLVWVGGTAGMVASGGLAVLLGGALGALLPRRATLVASTVLFVVFGLGLIVVSGRALLR